MKQGFKKIVLLTMLLTCLFGLCNPTAVYAEDKGEHQIVRVAFPESKGISQTHEDGTRSGVLYDWLVEIAKYTGWEYEFVEGSVEELLNMIKAGTVDIMGGMYYRSSLEEFCNYPHYSIGTSNSLLIKRRDDNSIQNFDLSTLNGKNIGVYKSAVNKIEQLKYFLSYNSLSCDLRTFENPDKMNEALENGEIDLLLGGDINLTQTNTVAAQLGGEPYYLVTSKAMTQLYKQLNEAITDVYMANPNFASEVHAAYFPVYYDSTIFLTDEDKAFIKNSPTVRVALKKDNYPLSYTRKGEKKGLCEDTFALISEQTGLEFEFIYADSYQEMLNLVQTGEADIVGSFMDEEDTAQSMNLILSKNYLSLDEVIIKNKKSNYPSDDLTFALVEGRDIPENIKPKKIRYFPTSLDCVNAIEKGEADVSFVPSAFLEELLYRSYYIQVTIVASNTAQKPISVAFPKSANVQLFSILNKAINSIPDSEMESIVSRNLKSMGESDRTIKSIIYSNPVAFIVILGSFIFLVALFILLYGKFKMKNRVMQIQLEKVKESNQVKSEFLSQMSHEIRTPMNAIIGLTQITLRSKEIPPQLSRPLKEIQSTSEYLLALVNDILDIAKIENSKMRLNPAPFKPRTLLEQTESMMRVQAEKKNIDMVFQCRIQNEYYIGDSLRIKQVIINLLSNALKFTNPNGKIVLSLTEIQQDKAQAELLFSVKDNGVGIDKKDLEHIFQSFEQTSDSNKVGQGTGLGLTISSNLVHLMGGELSVKSIHNQGSEFFFTLWLPICEPFIETNELLQKKKYKIDGMRILLAEDNDLNAKIVTFMLEEEGIKVEWASDGQMVIDMFANHPAGYYNLILMDIQMPVKSGLAATMEIRRLNRPDAKTIPIIAMTANSFKEDKDKTIEAGMDGFIPKPFKVEQLYEIVEECILNESQSPKQSEVSDS